MNITVNTKELLNGLNKLSKVISGKVSVPILTGVKITAKGDTLELIGSNIDFTGVITIHGVTVLEEGSHVLSFKDFHTFIKKSKSNDITIAKDGEKLTIADGKINLKAKGYNSSEYPRMPKIKSNNITLTNDEFKNAIKNTSYAVSTSESRPVLQCINIKVSDNIIKFVATDSHRLGEYKLNYESNIEFIEVNPIGSYLEKASQMIEKDNKHVTLKLNEQYTVLEFDNVELYIRNSESNYPDTSRLIPDNFNTELELNIKELLETLPQLGIYANTDRNSTMTLNYGDNVMVSAQNTENDEINANITNLYSYGEFLKLSFSLKYLEQSLKTMSNDNVKFKFSGSNRPFIMEADNNAKHLILPVRTY
ncbi:DNA polymerase III subunit beta [Psychrobacillus phage Perkons]|nr:DNA polymerase III subunit beta [Psychrobacillus phage Perkons]